MTRLIYLRAAAITETKARQGEAIEFFNEKKTLEEKETYLKSWYYTKSLNKQYKINHATTENQKIKVLIKLIKAYYKDDYLKKIKQIDEAEDILNKKIKIKSVEVTIKWSKNSTRGLNPHASINILASDSNFNEYNLTGKASGCGYDKRSAATAEAFNKSKILKAYLYKAKNKALKNKTVLEYGAGYGALPYFEGGVGFSSHEKILCKNIELKEIYRRESDKGEDSYYFEGCKHD